MKRPQRKNYDIGEYGEIKYIDRLERYCSYLENKNQQSGGITSVCDNCKDVTGFYLGMTCEKCNRPFRTVKQTDL